MTKEQLYIHIYNNYKVTPSDIKANNSYIQIKIARMVFIVSYWLLNGKKSMSLVEFDLKFITYYDIKHSIRQYKDGGSIKNIVDNFIKDIEK